MASDFHIKFDGIDGESTDKDHKGEIEVLSWNWNVSASMSASGGGSAAGKAVPGDFVFTHKYDKSSPVLAKNCAKGAALKQVYLTARKAGEGQKDFLKVTMKEVFITSVQPASDANDISETVSLKYAAIDFGYKPMDAKGGLGSEVAFSWNMKTGRIT
jgi:type VI secretion system secreted protein Hcp